MQYHSHKDACVEMSPFVGSYILKHGLMYRIIAYNKKVPGIAGANSIFWKILSAILRPALLPSIRPQHLNIFRDLVIMSFMHYIMPLLFGNIYEKDFSLLMFLHGILEFFRK